ncbi:uncharacterized protein [Venturia canescens]|uniref:uncharacterized protein n=1 Tax=Venturia canescens TaxID=32260 RepID=UPI001C9BDB75|nr:uncharacterized protein LOC122415915 [Venturia canescens]
MEGLDKKVLESSAIIYDNARKKYVCPLCKKKKVKIFRETHLKSSRHTTRLNAFNSVFLINGRQPLCKFCNKKLQWTQVQDHLKFHKVLPYWVPEDRNQRFVANFMTRVNSLYHCHLCDKVLKNSTDAWGHLENELHLELGKKIGDCRLEKQWDIRCNTWLIHGITPTLKKKIECRICNETMEPSEADQHLLSLCHTQKKLLYRHEVLKRGKKNMLHGITKPPQTSHCSQKIPLTFSNRPMICNFSISPDFSTSVTSQSEQVDSDEDSYTSDCSAMISPETETDLGDPSNLEESRATEKDCKNFEYLVSDPSWTIETSHPLMRELLSRKQCTQLCTKAATQAFYCLLCCDLLPNIESAKKHASDETHLGSLSKYGTNSILMDPTGTYHCGYCDSNKNDLAKMYHHLISDGHLKRVVKCNQLEHAQAILTQSDNQSEEIKTNDHHDMRPNFKDLDGIFNSSSSMSAQLTSSRRDSKSSDKDSPGNSKPELSLNSQKISPGSYSPLPVLDWVLETSQPLFNRIFSLKLCKKLAIDVETQLYYCLICSNGFHDKETAEKHVTGEDHAKTMQKLGCDRIVLLETGGYHCTCCDRRKNGFKEIYEHLLSDGHAKRLSQGPDNGQSAPVPSDNQSDEARPQNSGVSPPRHEVTIEVKSMKSDKESSDLEFLQRDLNWIIEVPVNVGKLFTHANEGTLYCLLCSEYFCNIKVARKHVSDQCHVNSMKRYGCDFIVLNETGDYHCTCCDKRIQNRDVILGHSTSSSHRKKLRKINQRNKDRKISDDAERELNGTRTNDDDVFQSTSKDFEEFSNLRSPSSDKSLSANSLSLLRESSRNNDESLPKIEPRPLPNFAENETDKNFDFRDEDLNWVVGYLHPLYGSGKRKNLESELAKSSKKSYCLICPAYFSRLQTALTHISSSKHTTSMEQRGCHYIEVTAQSKYRCTCCNTKGKDFQKIYSHVMSEGHKKKSDETNRINGRQPAVEFVENNPNTMKENDAGNSTAATILGGNLKFRETDLNWVVSRTHSLCKKKLAKNEDGELFYCLLCKFPNNGDGFDVDAAKNHISSDMHAGSMEKYGSFCIELTSKFRYNCVCCNRQKGSFAKIYGHVTSPGHVRQLQKFKRKDGEQSISVNAINRPSEVSLNDGTVEQAVSEGSNSSRVNSSALIEATRSENESNNCFASKVSETASMSSQPPKIFPITEGTAENLDFLKTDFMWVVDSSHSSFKKQTAKGPHEKECETTAGQLFYCRLCICLLPDPASVRNHIGSAGHAHLKRKHGCCYIKLIEKFKYLCMCCNRRKRTDSKMFSHAMSKTHVERVREMALDNPVVFEEDQTNEKNIKESNSEQLIMEKTNELLTELSLMKEASNNESKSVGSPSNPHKNDSQPSAGQKVSPPSRKPVKDLDYLSRDFNWVIDSSHAFFKKQVVKKSDFFSSDEGGEWFYCLICSWPNYGDAFDLETAKLHIRSKEHALSMDKHACRNIEVTWNPKYQCSCCDRRVDTLGQIYDHIKNSRHVNRLHDHRLLQKERSSVKLEATEFSQDERPENLHFFRRDLDWVISGPFKGFKKRYGKICDKNIVNDAGDQRSHCLVCSVDFLDATVREKHILSEEHTDSIKRYGYDFVGVTYFPIYRCRCCNLIERELEGLHCHIMSNLHAKTVRELAALCSQQSMGEPEVVCGDRGPRQVTNGRKEKSPFAEQLGAFSFDWPPPPPPRENLVKSYGKVSVSNEILPVAKSESNDWFSRNFPKIKLAPPTQRVLDKTSESFEFHDEDLNWVVHSTHSLYKVEKPRNLLEKATKSMEKRLFYCLVCFENFSSIENVTIHISCEEHGNAMKQLGCHFIEVLPGSKYHCVCCNRQKNEFYKIYNHVMSETHMNRLCEINGETDGSPALELVADKSTDDGKSDNAVGPGHSDQLQSFSTDWPTPSEKPFAPEENATPNGEASTSSLVVASCIFVSKKNAKKSFCHICADSELGVATKNLEEHINSMRHKLSLKRHGCDNIETREDGGYRCVCCDSEISSLQNVYLHVKDKKHMSSLIKAKPESRRLKKVTRNRSPESTGKVTGKALLSDFIGKKMERRDERDENDLYELVDSSQRYNMLPRYSGNVKIDMEKCHSIPGRLDNSNQPLLNSMLVSMAGELSRLNNQIENTERYKDLPDWLNFRADRSRQIATKTIPCDFCNHKVATRTDLHAHMAKHVSEELIAMNNSRLQNGSVSENNCYSSEFIEPEHFESSNQTIDSRGSPKELTDSSKFDQSLNEFSESSSDSDDELGYEESQENDPASERDLKEFLENAMKVSRSTKKVDFKDVIAKLNFKHNHIYDLDDKLTDLQRGLRMSVIIDNETIYCLVCRVRVSNTLKDYYAHLWSLDHCNYLDVMENDAEAFADFPDQFSDLELAHEYMEEISDSTVRCYLCNKSVANEDEYLRDHIKETGHVRACALMHLNASARFESMKGFLKCDWYGVERYSCFACRVHQHSEVRFMRHLNSQRHSKIMLKSPNFERKMLFDFCPSCAVLWYGYRSSYSHHVNEVDSHQWLANDGYYFMRDIPKLAQQLVGQPENWADRTIRHLDAIKADEASKVDDLIDDLQRIVRLTFPCAKAYPFGSRVSGLYFEDSDIDVFLDCRNVYDGQDTSESITLYFINNVHKCLSRNPETWDIHEVLTHCRSPIIRTYHRPTGLSCDISFDNGLCVEKTKLIKRIVEVYPAFRKLIVVLKLWLAYCDLAGSERITHNSLYWLVIFYLQNEMILPNIATLISMKNKSKIIAGCEVGVSYNFDQWESGGSSSVKHLLERFFTFYANFDFRYDVACPLLGTAINKHNFFYLESLPEEMNMYVRYIKKSRKAEMFRVDSPMCIQDPFDLPHNVTKAVRKNILNRFRTCCLKSLNFMAPS